MARRAGRENHQLSAGAVGERNGRAGRGKRLHPLQRLRGRLPGTDLLPQQLYWFSKGQQHDKATSHNLADCIECGACAWVCPSNIPLVQYFRQEKAEIYALAQEEKRAAEAKLRFEARQARLERDKAARLERHKQAAVQPAAKDQDAINAALARVREKQRDAAQPIIVLSGAKPDNSEAIAAREARKAEARARKAQQQAQSNVAGPSSDAAVDPRKAAVEAAIARAKARKVEQQAVPAEDAPAEQPAASDPRKAAVEVAIARAKARKAQQQAVPAEDAPAEQPAAVDPRKAAVEAAIARAKARKAQQQAVPAEDAPAEQPAAVDPRKAAVEAAIARAKARKAEQQQQAVPPSAANDDARKAAVAEAIARVQARKASRQAVNED